MMRMSDLDVVSLLLGVGVLLALARGLGEVARRFDQPKVLGELLAGILLGPSVLGSLAPAAAAFLFPLDKAPVVAMQAFSVFGIVLFLLVAGMEMDLDTALARRRAALRISALGVGLPYVLGFAVTWPFPEFFGKPAGVDPRWFSLFIAAALSMSALPMVAKMLMDLGYYKTETGSAIMTSALINDVCDWVSFALVVGIMGDVRNGFSQVFVILGLVAFTALMITLGRRFCGRAMAWLAVHSEWPGGPFGFIFSCTLLCAAFTEFIGVHAAFGGFLAGVALGGPTATTRTRDTLRHFIGSFFTPLFFGAIGLQVDFRGNFDPLLTLAIIALAMGAKLAGSGLGARLSGFPWRDSLAIGVALSSRGAVEIVVGLMALNYGIIEARLFVALVCTAMASSLLAGPLLRRLLGKQAGPPLAAFLPEWAYLPHLAARDPREAVLALAEAAAQAIRRQEEEEHGPSIREACGVDAGAIARAVLEVRMPPTPCDPFAVHGARVRGLTSPLVALGLAREGVDYPESPEARAAAVALVLTPRDEEGLHESLMQEVQASLRELNGRLTGERPSHAEILRWLREPVPAWDGEVL